MLILAAGAQPLTESHATTLSVRVTSTATFVVTWNEIVPVHDAFVVVMTGVVEVWGA
jgi:hypothetical protein